MGLPSPYVFHAFVDIAICFFDTNLSLLIRFWYVIEVKWKEVVTVASVPYLCFETSWMNDIVTLVKREKLTSDGDYRLQRINAGLESIILTKRPSYI